MPIPEEQLQTWSNLGAEVSAAATYESIKAALEARTSPVRQRRYTVYLQGSYRNKTNIYGDSDVDVVVELLSAFGYDLDALSESQRTEFHRVHPGTVDYTFQLFRADVERSLIQYYGTNYVKPHNKCIQVLKDGRRLDADIVPCQSFRYYQADPSVRLPKYAEGIAFYTRRESRRVVNYPKLHFENGGAKNQRCGERYKPSVRIFKNLRNYLQAEGKIVEDSAPSYFVECLLYNVPDRSFGATSLQQRVASILVWFHDNVSTAGFTLGSVCGNGIVPLFGTSPEQWTVAGARQYIEACINAWNNW